MAVGLEPTLTDALSKAIIERVILPRFRRGEFAGGIAAGIDEIGRVIENDPAAIALQTPTGEGAGVDWTMLILVLLWLAFILYLQWRAHRAARHRPSSARRCRTWPLRHDPIEERPILRNHRRLGETRLIGGPPGRAQPFCEGGMVEHGGQRPGQRLGILDRHEEPGLTGCDQG